MALLEAKNISHSFGDKVLYKKSSFELFKGEHMGLVGRNGTGKTTLLNSLIGEIIPDTGEIHVQKGMSIGYLDQYIKINDNVTLVEYLKTAFEDLYDIEKKLNELYEKMAVDFSEEILNKSTNYQSLLENRGFYEIESTILKVADGLGINSFGMNSFLSNLSGGQKARVILAKLLLKKPDLLLLDEPTNFLDKSHISWLTEYLKAFKGAFIVISHDFEFLDKITTCILDIEFETIKKYVGNFSKFIKLKGLHRESYIREFEAQKRQIKKYEDYIAKNRARASTARQAQGKIKMLNKIERIPPPESVPPPNFSLKSLPISHQKALMVQKLKVGYTSALLPALSFEMMPNEKTVITGFNGIGKSTLLKTLMGEIPKISGGFHFSENTQIGYFEQDLKWQNDLKNPLEIVTDKFPKMSQSDVRKHLARCGLKSKHILRPVGTLSGGEQAKVKICILTLTKCNFLILDEPTNHLDLDSKNILQRELIKWEGGIILVSHEESFYKKWCGKIINIESKI